MHIRSDSSGYPLEWTHRFLRPTEICQETHGKCHCGLFGAVGIYALRACVCVVTIGPVQIHIYYNYYTIRLASLDEPTPVHSVGIRFVPSNQVLVLISRWVQVRQPVSTRPQGLTVQMPHRRLSLLGYERFYSRSFNRNSLVCHTRGDLEARYKVIVRWLENQPAGTVLGRRLGTSSRMSCQVYKYYRALSYQCIILISWHR